MGAIRLFLALVVVCDHVVAAVLNRNAYPQISPWLKLGLNGGFAVILFFVVSGFLISFALARKYPVTRAGTLDFYRSRVIRIFSLYWPVMTIAALFLPEVRDNIANVPWPDAIAHVFVLGTDWLLIFGGDYPAVRRSALVYPFTQVWSLAPELTFYALAPFALRRPRLAAALLAGSLALRVWLAQGPWSPSLQYYFFPSLLVFFLLGQTARLLADRLPLLRSGRAGSALLAAAVLALCVPTWSAWDSVRFWIAVLAFALALPGIFAATKDTVWLSYLGELSFPVFMIHMVPVYLLRSHLVGLPQTTATGYTITLGFVAIALALGAAALHLLERPTARFMKRQGFPTLARRLPQAVETAGKDRHF